MAAASSDFMFKRTKGFADGFLPLTFPHIHVLHSCHEVELHSLPLANEPWRNKQTQKSLLAGASSVSTRPAQVGSTTQRFWRQSHF